MSRLAQQQCLTLAGSGLAEILHRPGGIRIVVAGDEERRPIAVFPHGRLYSEAAEYAATRGVIIADTKFEFGVDDKGGLVLIDEVLTPDSSRFWPAAEYRTGTSPPSFDKQFVRDWLETQPWNKKAPAPALPPDVLRKTSEKYREALRLLTS